VDPFEVVFSQFLRYVLIRQIGEVAQPAKETTAWQLLSEQRQSSFMGKLA